MQLGRIILASAIVAAFVLHLATAAAAGGIVEQSIDALFNLRNQLQGVVMRSVQGVADAMQEGLPAQGPEESWIDYYNRRQRHYKLLYGNSQMLVQAPQNLLTTNLQLLTKLPKADPRRQEIERDINGINEGIGENRASRDLYKAKLAEFKKVIDDYNRKHGLPRTKSEAPTRRPEPPSGGSFEARAISLHTVPDGSPFRWLLTHWERSNKRLSARFSKEVDHRFEGRFCLVRPCNAPSELVIERTGTGLRIPDSEWDAFTRPGTRLTDIPDPSYGKWVSNAYLSVLRTGRPNLNDVSAKIYLPCAGRLLYEYRRMILPCLDAEGQPLLLGASIAAVRLCASLEAA